MSSIKIKKGKLRCKFCNAKKEHITIPCSCLASQNLKGRRRGGWMHPETKKHQQVIRDKKSAQKSPQKPTEAPESKIIKKVRDSR